MDIYIGFDSAWTDNPKAPGAICAVAFEDSRFVQFYAPRLVTFDQALEFIRAIRSPVGNTLIAIDQPTIVPNLKSMRPVERVAASLVSWLGGGVQPSNRGRIGMFCDSSPIWKFLKTLDAIQNPEQARAASNGIYIMEVFPALALASLDPSFFGRLRAPRYNPARKKTFKLDNWASVATVAANEAASFGCEEIAAWCTHASESPRPGKVDQDMLDSVLCALIALRWRLGSRTDSLLLGDMATGYMVLPTSNAVRDYLTVQARKLSVQIDGLNLS
jgi:predicted RNase H-like nuclease